MDTSPLAEYWARPGQSMEAHTSGVADAGRTLIDGAGTNPYGDDWGEVVETLAWIHDIGKLTTYFQTYIRTGDRTAAESSELTYHGTFGGFATVLALYHRGMEPETVAAGFYAVQKHHSVLQNIPGDFRGFFEESPRVKDRYEQAREQVDDIGGGAHDAADVLFRRATDGAYGWGAFANSGFDRVQATLKEIQPATPDDDFYGCVLRAWSTLVAADKADASGLRSDPDLPLDDDRTLNVECLTERVRSLADTPLPNGRPAASYLDDPLQPLPDSTATIEQRLAAVRTAANGRASKALQEYHQRGDRVFGLTLPTGFGKTFSGLRAALQLADTRDSRVIYALPYTSIIDQVDEKIRDVFGVTPAQPIYTKHHHLADTRSTPGTGADEDDRLTSGRDTLHAETWRSRLILTTFTQLFESAAGPGNVQSAKLPALQDSVIIIDEPQALPLKWWALVGRLTSHLANEYDATILFMTATQPRLLEELPEAPTPQPLVDLQDDCAELLADTPRVTFDLHPSLTEHLDGNAPPPLPLASAAAELTADLTSGTNTLAVVNTVGCATALSEALSSPGHVALGDELLTYLRETEPDDISAAAYLESLAESYPSPELLTVTLTTRLRPIDRQLLLDALSRILDPDVATPFDSVPTVTVSTQLIEAGVDVSFDQLYRDYGPLPAFVQAAGRCNREFGGEPASVTVWRLDSPIDDDYIPCQLIYESLLRPTQHALSALRADHADDVLPEAAMITDGVDDYYCELHAQRRTRDRVDGLVDAFNGAEGETLREASLINTEYATRDYLVLVNPVEQAAYERYKTYRKEERWQAARTAFDDLKHTLVSVPVTEGMTTEAVEAVDLSPDDDRYDVVFGGGVMKTGVENQVEI